MGKAASIARRLPWRLASDELRMTEEQKRPLTGGAFTSKNAPSREAHFLLFSENIQPLMTARILAMASARFSQPSFK